MTLLLGCALGLGLVLAVSPLLWPITGSTARRPRATDGMRERLTQAGLHTVSPLTLVAVSLIVGLALAAITYAVAPVVPLSVAALIVGIVAPALMVRWRARARRRTHRGVWPDVVDHLVGGVRAGVTLPDSLVLLASTGPEPTRDAFRSFERTYRATGDFGLGVDELKSRLADPAADRLLENIRMSREVGGRELTTVLRNLAGYLRHDAAIRAEAEARQSWVVGTAKLGVAAPWIVLLLLASRPEAAVAYNSPAGAVLVLGGLVVSVVAYRIMLAIGRLPEERRWFR